MLEAGDTGAFGRMGGGGDLVLKHSGGVAAQKAFYRQEHVPTDDAGIQRLNADFKSLMKAEVPDNTLFYRAQVAAEQILHAIASADTDPDGEKIAAALRAMTPQSRYLGKVGWRGKAQDGIDRQLAFTVGMGLIVDGKEMPMTRLEVQAEAP